MRFELHRLQRRAAAEPAPSPSPDQHIPIESDPTPAASSPLDELLSLQARLAATAQAMADGNLARDVEVSSEDDTLGVAFRDMLAGLRRLVGQVKDGAADVDAGAHAAGDAIRSADASVVVSNG